MKCKRDYEIRAYKGNLLVNKAITSTWFGARFKAWKWRNRYSTDVRIIISREFANFGEVLYTKKGKKNV